MATRRPVPGKNESRTGEYCGMHLHRMERESFCTRRHNRGTASVRLVGSIVAALIGVGCLTYAAISQGRKLPTHRAGGTYAIGFTLSGDCFTSAGIFGSNGQLVRTLWGNRPMTAGVKQETWDGTDDFGNALSPDTFTVKLLTHNVYPHWDGTIGNSSTYQTGTTKIAGLGGYNDVVSVGADVFLLRKYMERGERVTRFNKAEPGLFTPSGVVGMPFGYFATCFATDGKYMYLGAQPIPQFTSNPTPIVCAYNLDEVSGALTFSGIVPVAGTGVGQNNNGQWLSVGSPASLAVQTKGPILAIDQGAGQVGLFNKLTGLPLSGAQSTLPVTGVTTVRWSADEATLWVAVGSNVTGWQFVGNTWTAINTIPGASPVKSFAVNPADGSVAILYAGSDQQVRAYTPGGTWLYTVGSRGGYLNGPTVNDTKFMIGPINPAVYSLQGGVAFQSDGELWILDGGNQRVLRFPVHKHLAVARKNAEVRQINSYMLAVDPNNPARVISGYLEFERDYTQPLSAGNGLAWKLVNNWGYGYLFQGLSTQDGITEVVSGSNGRVYAQFEPATWLSPHVVELTPSGVRDIAAIAAPYEHAYLDAQMNLWNWTGFGTSQVTAMKAPLTGFDGSNNPKWGTSVAYCSMPLAAGQPTFDGARQSCGGMPIPLLPDGSVVSFNTTTGPPDYNGYYLGFVKKGASNFWAKTAQGELATPLTHDGRMPLSTLPNAKLIPDIGGRVCGDLIAQFANGEFFDSAESNQILLYHSSGLFITDFGTRSAGDISQAAPSGKSGNFYGNAFLQCPDGNTRIFHSDESSHAGIHEWTLLNLSTINVVAGQFDGTNTVNLGSIGPRKQGPRPTGPITTISDTFNRADSSTVGGGWLDPNHSFAIKGGRLKVNYPLWGAIANTVLLAPGTCSDSDQTIQIPAQYFDGSKMASSPNEIDGYWGVVSRYQQDGSRYLASMRYVRFPSDVTALSGNGVLKFEIGMCVGGQIAHLGYDDAFYLPASPGHSYSLRLQTTGIAPTRLQMTVTDQVTGTQYVVLDQLSDEPSLQAVGGVGIQAGYFGNEFSSYNATINNSSVVRTSRTP